MLRFSEDPMRRTVTSLFWAITLVAVSIAGTHLTDQGKFLWRLFAIPVWPPMAFVLVSTGRFTEAATEPFYQLLAVALAVLMWWVIILVGRGLWPLLALAGRRL
jgi:hypothetical protein